MSKVSLFVKVRSKPGKRAELLEAFGKAREALEAETGTERFILNAAQDDENLVLIYERYESMDALMAHSKGEALRISREASAELTEGDAEIILAQEISGKGL
jgi:quinol monooxygenase YgiN